MLAAALWKADRVVRASHRRKWILDVVRRRTAQAVTAPMAGAERRLLSTIPLFQAVRPEAALMRSDLDGSTREPPCRRSPRRRRRVDRPTDPGVIVGMRKSWSKPAECGQRVAASLSRARAGRRRPGPSGVPDLLRSLPRRGRPGRASRIDSRSVLSRFDQRPGTAHYRHRGRADRNMPDWRKNVPGQPMNRRRYLTWSPGSQRNGTSPRSELAKLTSWSDRTTTATSFCSKDRNGAERIAADAARHCRSSGSRLSGLNKPEQAQSWISLGRWSSFPKAKPAWRHSRTPSPALRTAKPRKSPAGCGVSKGSQFQVFAINCAHLGCPVRWFPQSRLVHVSLPRWRVSTRTARTPRVRRRAGCYEYHHKVENGAAVILGGSAADPRRSAAAGLRHV